MTSATIFAGKSVLITGHTGFKGSWLAEWLLKMGASVTGFSLPPPTRPALFEQLGLADRLNHQVGDVRDPSAVARAVQLADPDFVFHLAAQPLVRLSYREPVETWATNVMGTLHLLQALRNRERPCAVVLATTDKVYENREWDYAYREEDALGGYDPYSSSKAAAEIAIAAWRRSFFSKDHPVRIASARAGNVIGGGDWAEDRIVPDAIRALSRGEAIPVRNPHSTRPWQHVLEPLSGYLRLAEKLRESADLPARAFNFGPVHDSNRPVSQLIDEILRHWPGSWINQAEPGAVHEAGKLNLATERAFHVLQWQPRWGFAPTIKHTVDWYRAARAISQPEEFQHLTRNQISEFETANRF